MTYLTLIGTSNGRNWLHKVIDLPRGRQDRYIDKREAAIRELGERWVCDSSRHVPRGQYEQQTHGADVAATFARIRERMKGVVA